MVWKNTIADLKSHDDSIVLGAIASLASELSMAQEDTLVGLPSEELISILIQLLHKDDIQEIMLNACICITQLVDTIPSIAATIVSKGGITALVQKMMEIQYIDVTEKAIGALDKISIEAPSSVLSSGALISMLTIIDFFEMEAQSKIMNISCNIVEKIPNENLINEQIIPAISNIMQRLDPSFSIEIISLALKFFNKIIDGIR